MSSYFRFLRSTSFWCQVSTWAVFALLIGSVLWRGGKSLDAAWILTGVASLSTIIWHCTNKGKGESVPVSLWLCAIGLSVLTALSYYHSQTSNYGVDEVLQTGSLALLLFWTIRYASHTELQERRIEALLKAITLVTFIACIVGSAVYVLQPVNRFVGTFFDYRFHTDYWPNAWGQYVLLTWPVCLYTVLKHADALLGSAKQRFQLLLRCCALGLLLSCLVVSYSRASFLVFAVQVAALVGVLYYHQRTKRCITRSTQLLVAIGLCALLLTFAMNTARSQFYSVQNMEQKLTLQAAEGTSSVTERFAFWGQATTLTKEQPLLGFGPYSFRFVQTPLQQGVLQTSDHAHNVLLKLSMERGIFAALLFAVLVGMPLFALGKRVKANPHCANLGSSRGLLIGIGIFGVLLHNMLDYNLQFVGIAATFWVLIALLSVECNSQNSIKISRWCSASVEILLAVALLAFALYEGSYLAISSLGRHAEAAGDTVKAMQWYDKSAPQFFTRDLHLSRTKIHMDNNRLASAQGTLDEYFAQNEHDYRAWKRQGDIALADGKHQLALEVYNRAFTMGKYNDVGIMHGLLRAYRALGDRQEITRKKPMFDRLLQEYADAIAANVHHIALSPNVEEFVGVCNTLARMYRKDAPRYEVMAARADHHARVERGRIQSRPPGYLW